MAKIRKELQKQNLHRAPVLIEDTNPSSTYFQIREMPDVLHAGKNGFLIIGSKFLTNTTSVQVEILDANGDPIFQQPIARYAEGQARIVSIEIYETTPPGPATITILGSARTYADGRSVPDEWIGKLNVRWQKTVPVDSLRPNTSKIRTYRKPKINVTEILSPFRKAQTGSVINVYGGSVSATGKSSLRSTGEAFDPIYTITLSTGSVSQSMVGAAFTASWGGASEPGSSSLDREATFTGSYSASIVEVYNDRTFVVEPALQNVDKTIYQNFVTSNFTISFQDRPVFENTTLTRSFAEFFLSDLRTFTGDIQRTKLFVKSIDSEGAFEQIYDAQIEGSNLTQTQSALLGIAAKMGEFYSQSVINEFWRAGVIRGPTLYDSRSATLTKKPTPINPYSSSANFVLSRNTSKLIDSMWSPTFETHPSSAPIGYGQTTQSAPSYFFEIDEVFKFTDELEYTLQGDVLCELSGSPSGGRSTARLDVYLSGSAFPNVTSSLGQLITTFEFDTTLPEWSGAPSQTAVQPFRNFEVNFIPPRSGSARLFFAPAGGTWYLSDINLISSIERGFNPDEAKFLVPIIGKRFETLQFKAQLFDPSNNVFPVELISDEVFFDGGNVFLRGGDNRIEGSLTVAPSGSGVTLTSRGWYSASVFQIGESAIYLGEGDFASSSTPFLVAQSGSNNDPFFSIADKLIGYNDPDTGEFQLVLSGSLTVISGTLQVPRLSDITGNLGVVVAGRIQNSTGVSSAGILLGGPEPSHSLVDSNWNAYMNLSATGSQPVLFVRPESASIPTVRISADGTTIFGGQDATANVIALEGTFETLRTPDFAVRPTTGAIDEWTGSRVEMLISDLVDPGQNLFRVYNNKGEADIAGHDGEVFSIGSYTVTQETGGGGTPTATSSTNWGATASVEINDSAIKSGSATTIIELSGVGVDALDDKYTVRWGITLDNTNVSVEESGQAEISMTGYLQYRKDGGVWTTVTNKSLSETIVPGVGSSQSSRFTTNATITGEPTTVDIRVRVTQTRTEIGVVNGTSKAQGYGETDTGVTWTYEAGGSGGFQTTERFNPRFYGGVSASTATPHYQMVPITNSVALPPDASGSEGEFIYISGSGPYYHDGTSWQAFGSGSGGSIGGSGTTNKVTKWIAATTLGDSTITDDGSKITLGSQTTASAGLSSSFIQSGDITASAYNGPNAGVVIPNELVLGGRTSPDKETRMVISQSSDVNVDLPGIRIVQNSNAGKRKGAIWMGTGGFVIEAEADTNFNFYSTGESIWTFDSASQFWRFDIGDVIIADGFLSGSTAQFSGEVSASTITGSFTTSLGGESSASWAERAFSSSHALAADSADLATDAVTATTASYALAVAPEAFNDPRQVTTSAALFYDINEDLDFTIFMDTSGGDRNVKLPNITGTTNGRIYNIVKVVAANIVHVIAFDSNDDVIGNPTKSLTDQYQSLTVQASGSTWWVI